MILPLYLYSYVFRSFHVTNPMYYPADLLWLPVTVHGTSSFLVTTLHVMSSTLKDTSAALEKALNEPSVSDLSASDEQHSSLLNCLIAGSSR